MYVIQVILSSYQKKHSTFDLKIFEKNTLNG